MVSQSRVCYCAKRIAKQCICQIDPFSQRTILLEDLQEAFKKTSFFKWFLYWLYSLFELQRLGISKFHPLPNAYFPSLNYWKFDNVCFSLDNSDTDVNDVVYAEEEEIHKLKIELAENQRERDMLASELDLVRSELKKEMTLPLSSLNLKNADGEDSFDYLMAEKSRLINENEDLIKTNIQLSSLQQLVWEEGDKSPEDLNAEKIMSRLLKQLETTKRENEKLSKKLSGESGGRLSMAERVSTATSPLRDTVQTVVTPVEIQSLKHANVTLKQELDTMKKEREKFKRDLARIQQLKVSLAQDLLCIIIDMFLSLFLALAPSVLELLAYGKLQCSVFSLFL